LFSPTVTFTPEDIDAILYIVENNSKLDHVNHIGKHSPTETIVIENLLDPLFAHDVISSVEMNDVRSEKSLRKQLEKLQSLISMKSAEEFGLFLTVLSGSTGQTDGSTILRNTSTTPPGKINGIYYMNNNFF